MYNSDQSALRSLAQSGVHSVRSLGHWYNVLSRYTVIHESQSPDNAQTDQICLTIEQITQLYEMNTIKILPLASALGRI